MKMHLLKLLKRRSSLFENPLPGFDTAYYLDKNPDVRSSGCNPRRHYLEHGWKEGRDPSLGFSTSGYLAANPDVEAAGENPLVHFLNFGFSEGRRGYFEETFPPAPQLSQGAGSDIATGTSLVSESERRLSASLMAPSKSSLPRPGIKN